MSILDVISWYNHIYVCDWIHNVLIIMLVFYVSTKSYEKDFIRMIFLILV